MTQTYLKLREIHPGFRPEGVLTLRIALPASRYESSSQVGAFLEELERRLAGEPGVTGVAAVSSRPMAERGTIDFVIRGRPGSAAGGALNAEYRVVSPTHFDVLGIPLRSGRAFSAEDDGDCRGVAIVNETFARELLPGVNPVGKGIRLPRERVAGSRSSESWRTPGSARSSIGPFDRRFTFPCDRLPVATSRSSSGRRSTPNRSPALRGGSSAGSTGSFRFTTCCPLPGRSVRSGSRSFSSLFSEGSGSLWPRPVSTPSSPARSPSEGTSWGFEWLSAPAAEKSAARGGGGPPPRVNRSRRGDPRRGCRQSCRGKPSRLALGSLSGACISSSRSSWLQYLRGQSPYGALGRASRSAGGAALLE